MAKAPSIVRITASVFRAGTPKMLKLTVRAATTCQQHSRPTGQRMTTINGARRGTSHEQNEIVGVVYHGRGGNPVSHSVAGLQATSRSNHWVDGCCLLECRRANTPLVYEPPSAHVMQNRICKHLRHPTEAFVIPANAGIEAMRRADELDIDLCNWSQEKMPPHLQRQAGASLRDCDCDHCPCFEPAATPKWRGDSSSSKDR